MVEILLWIIGGVVLIGLACAYMHWCRCSLNYDGGKLPFGGVVLGGLSAGVRNLSLIRRERKERYKMDRAITDYKNNQSATLGMIEKELKQKP